MKKKLEMRTAAEITKRIRNLQEEHDSLPVGHSMKDGILKQIQILHWVQGEDNPSLRPHGRIF